MPFNPKLSYSRIRGHIYSQAGQLYNLLEDGTYVNVYSVGAGTGSTSTAKGDGVTDDAPAIQAAINTAVANGGGDVYLPRGTYLIKSRLVVTSSNVRIVGDGMGQTVILMDASMTASTSGAIQFYSSTIGSTKILIANAVLGDTRISLPFGTTGLSAGSYVLLRSLKIADSSSTSKFVGEIHKIVKVYTNGAANVTISVATPLGDSYLVSDGAEALPITVLENVGVSDLSITHAATSAPSIVTAALELRFCRNARVERVHIHDVFHTGVDLYSCLDTAVTGSRIEDVKSASSLTVYYGVWVASASRNISVTDNFFARCRHSVTTGTHTSSVGALSTNGNEGTQRSVEIADNKSYGSTTAHFDTHMPAEGVSFCNNQCYGAWPEGAPDTTVWNNAVFGIQARSDKTVIEGNTIEFCSGGIMIFAAESKDVTIANNVIRDIFQPRVTTQLYQAVTNGQATLTVNDTSAFAGSGTMFVGGVQVTYSGKTFTALDNATFTGCSGVTVLSYSAIVQQYYAGGHGIVFDSAATGTGFVVDGNIIVNVDGGGIVGNGNQSGVVVQNNLVKNWSLGKVNNDGSANTYPGINLGGAAGPVDISRNRVQDCAANVPPIQITGSADNHRIEHNSFSSLTRFNPAWVGDHTIVSGNLGFTPGNTSNFWPNSPFVLKSNIGGGGNLDPVSAATYTVGSGPCTILVFGGTVTQIAINSNAVTGVTSGVFHLQPGETIKITCSVSPTTRIFWD